MKELIISILYFLLGIVIFLKLYHKFHGLDPLFLHAVYGILYISIALVYLYTHYIKTFK